MKDIFKGYYRIEEKHLREMWDSAVFIFDANVLLNMYRYSTQARDKYFDILNFLNNRIWLPHHACLEYQENRLSVIAEQCQRYDDIEKTIHEPLRKLKEIKNDDLAPIKVDNMIKALEKAYTIIDQELKLQKKSSPIFQKSDLVRERISHIFQGKVGGAYNQQKIDEIATEGAIRYKFKIPPGYKDINKEATIICFRYQIPAKYGDLIIWNQIIDKTLKENRPVIFITDDKKEDWWWIDKGETIGPHPQLITEFYQLTSCNFHMYTSKRLLEIANKAFGIEVSRTIVSNVENISNELRIDWLTYAIRALEALNGVASLSRIYIEFKKIADKDNLKLPRSWQPCLRKTFYYHSSDVDLYKGKNDIFERVDKGIWSLREIEHSKKMEQKRGENPNG